MAISGRTTTEGTRRFCKRHESDCAKTHFRKASGLTISSMGIGTYLGAPDDATDAQVTDAVVESVKRGVNLIDTAINYRFERAERSIGEALRQLLKSCVAARDELVLCTKGGFLPHQQDPVAWFQKEYLERQGFGITMSDLAVGCHCLHPDYLSDQLERSLENLGVENIDVYYLHNPETELRVVESEEFEKRLLLAFRALEAACDQGKISAWGLATWNAFRSPPGDPEHLELAQVKALARKAARGGKDHFRFIQLPFNLAMPEALLATQEIAGERVPVLEVARRLGVLVVGSASICQGRLVGKLSPQLAEILGKEMTDAQRALQFTRGAPGLLSALVGMKDPEHVKENLALLPIQPLDAKAFLAALQSPG